LETLIFDEKPAARMELQIASNGETRFAPLHPLYIQEANKKEPNMSAWKTHSRPVEPRIVLVVSQDVKMVAAWELTFKRKGCHVIHEKTPRHALQAARLLQPALVILDLDLTQSERLSLCRELRPMTRNALLLLAPKNNDEEVAEYYRAGVDERLSPTVSPATLLGTSLAWLSQ
jgi:CheY-like chemotaxis protein